jgi:Arc/MetJ family transcription regulator
MRTNIEIDDKLMKEAMKATGATTKKAAVEAALLQTLRLKRQERIRRWFGRGEWDGNLAESRMSRFLDESGFFAQDADNKIVVRSGTSGKTKKLRARDKAS